MFDPSFLGGLTGGLIAGVLATLTMDVAMARLPEGETPPKVAASVLAGTAVDSAPERLAAVVHYVAGAGSGVLTAAMLAGGVAVAAALGVGTAGVGAVVTAAGVAFVMFVCMVGFFALVPLPRTTGLARQRLRVVRRDWAICAVVYLVVAIPLLLAVGQVV
ncbi:hypothetical protein [Halorubrum vacuolatum]|uniref:Uncharacterized protein n=1 Tax=Halorubrum vacuolatum TaxID=63740 RepID=A0A238X2N3_HALVU|nr:hypothetical protein [Halorubrum vacuolatum]SNR52843.1 hypothetical protein SAMN06264855_11275 [Halorubrum vacuolatum]